MNWRAAAEGRPLVEPMYWQSPENVTAETGIEVDVATASSDTYEQTLKSELIEKLCERLESGDLDHGQPRLVEDAKNRYNNIGAARTHGDLWSGNVMWTPEGAVLIDPAAQGGHAEEDLAALAVFGCPHYEQP